jgi:indolepyruvate ferredoxin oxidoreductase alpha subunit
MPEKVETVVKLPPRPPTLCPGCPHRTIYSILAEMDIVVSGDIGCYSLGALPPYNCMDTCIDMGAAVTFAQGVEMATDGRQDCVAILGDSTFAHSGITGLLNAAYNKRKTVVIVLDNGTTAMTGIQPNPCSGETINGEPTVVLDYVKLGEACGLDKNNIRIVDAYDKAAVETALKSALAAKKLSLLVIKGPCIILRNKQKKSRKQH